MEVIRIAHVLMVGDTAEGGSGVGLGGGWGMGVEEREKLGNVGVAMEPSSPSFSV